MNSLQFTLWFAKTLLTLEEDPKAFKTYRNGMWNRANRARCRVSVKKWEEKNPDKKRLNYKRWRIANPHYEAVRGSEDPQYRLVRAMRKRIWDAVKRATKSKRTELLIGCTPQILKQHLEKSFLPGMSWENYGEWHVDHIRPCATFDLSNHDQQRACFHFSNLQPLWGEDNFRKGAKWLNG